MSLTFVNKNLLILYKYVVQIFPPTAQPHPSSREKNTPFAKIHSETPPPPPHVCLGGETHQTLLHIITLSKPWLQISVYFSDSGTFCWTCKFCIYAFAYVSRTHSLLFSLKWCYWWCLWCFGHTPPSSFLVSWFFVGLLGLKYVSLYICICVGRIESLPLQLNGCMMFRIYPFWLVVDFLWGCRIRKSYQGGWVEANGRGAIARECSQDGRFHCWLLQEHWELPSSQPSSGFTQSHLPPLSLPYIYFFIMTIDLLLSFD